MKRIHRKIIALQARVARRAAKDLVRNVSKDRFRYQAARGKNFDLFKASYRAGGAKPTTLAKIIRAIVSADRKFGALACRRGESGSHTYNRIYGFDFNNRSAFIRILVGPFNEGLIEEDENGVMYIRDESSFSTIAQLIP